ncbi:MAG: 1-deoxy-D-xylulose-5-phosphate synthase [Phycisphaera sp.]|nr:1-deoxy-D-xylulose-5-phosphate synthase [Phycisphaera sp.]
MEFELLDAIRSPRDLKALPIDRLDDLAAEIRQAICEQVRRSGGHLAPNLGVVELTIAMHYVFDFGHDRLLFDVGHQCYPHKLLTGRLPMLAGLRTRQGMSGFPEPRESEYDLFSVGHAGTGISTAVGMARGDTLNQQGWSPENETGRRAVSIIGDASIVNGLAMEGLNNAGTLDRQFLVVLNDNGMSIAKPQGAVAAYFDRVRLSHSYGGFKKAAKEFARHIPGGETLSELYHRMGEMSKAMISEDAWFEKFNLVTVGPVDGHDIRTLIDFLNEAAHFDRPMVLHVKTVKGKGYGFAEGDATQFHSPGAFEVVDRGEEADEASELVPEGCRVEIRKSGRSFTSAYGDAMLDLMKRDSKVVACTAAMPDGTGISKVMPEFPDRTWDTGICESHAMDMMAGMAKTGWKPFFAVYSTFLQRAFDQAFQEVSLQGLAVRLCLDRAGFVGGDGAVHHGFCDISILAPLPDAAICAAMDEPSLVAALDFMADYDQGLSAIRYPRDNVSERFVADCPPFELGKARALSVVEKPDVAILGYGVMAITGMEVKDELGDEYSVSVYDARFAKPVDDDLLVELLGSGVRVFTVEDHSVKGGFGTQVLEAANRLGLDSRLVTVCGMPDGWVYQGARTEQLAEVELDVTSLARKIRESLGGEAGSPASDSSATRIGRVPAS